MGQGAKLCLRHLQSTTTRPAGWTPLSNSSSGRAELRELRRVRVWKDRLQVFDVNKDIFEIRGIGYADPDVVPLLRMINAAFNPQTIHEPTDVEYKEFDTGRRYTWAHDRVM